MGRIGTMASACIVIIALSSPEIAHGKGQVLDTLSDVVYDKNGHPVTNNSVSNKTRFSHVSQDI